MGYTALLISAVLAATTLPLLKFGTLLTDVETLLILRFGLSFALLYVFYMIFNRRCLLLNKNLVKLIVTGFFLPLAILLINHALKYISVSLGNALLLFSPVITTLFAIYYLEEKVTKHQKLGITLSIFGVFLALVNAYREEGNIFLGAILIVCAVILSSIYTTASKKLSNLYTPIEITLISLFDGFILFFVLFYLKHSSIIISREILNVTIALTIFGTLGQFLLFQYAVSKTSAFVSGLFPFIQFPLTIILGKIFFGDIISYPFILEIIFILSGAFIASELYPKKLTIQAVQKYD